MSYQQSFGKGSRSRGTTEISAEVARIVRAAGGGDGGGVSVCGPHAQPGLVDSVAL